jgi:hypothetical protein
MDFVYHTFVPVCTLKDRNCEAPISLSVENVNKINVVLYDFNSINHPNLMGARRSCGQFYVQMLYACTHFNLFRIFRPCVSLCEVLFFGWVSILSTCLW